MSISSDGQICFGIAFEEGFEFPWDDTEDYGDKKEFEEWYAEQHGWDKSKHQYAWQWEKDNPIPFELVWHCGYDYPMFILAIKGTYIRASRGYIEELDLLELVSVVTDEKVSQLKQFCEKHGIKISREPKWYLSSMYG